MTHYLLLYPDRWVPSVVTILQLVVTSLFRAGWTLGRIVCIFVVWLGIFAIMGVLLWSGEIHFMLESPCHSPVSCGSLLLRDFQLSSFQRLEIATHGV